MRKIFFVTLLTIFAVAMSQVAFSQDAEARKVRILDNLKVKYPQLSQGSVTMGEITPTEFGSLSMGSFTISSQRGQQTQSFLVSDDDTKLYFIAGEAIDVSKSSEVLQAEVAEREAEEARQAAARHEELQTAIAGQPMRGNPDAPITIVEYSDFQCGFCARAANTVEQVIEKYPNEVKVVYQHFPLGFHPWAKPAAIASHCASKQNPGAFWTLHDKFFEHQKEITVDNIVAKSKEFLEGSGIDVAKWATCAESTDSEEYKAAAEVVDAHMAMGSKHGVSGTPGFFINGHFLNGAQPIDKFEEVIAKLKDAS